MRKRIKCESVCRRDQNNTACVSVCVRRDGRSISQNSFSRAHAQTKGNLLLLLALTGLLLIFTSKSITVCAGKPNLQIFCPTTTFTLWRCEDIASRPLPRNCAVTGRSVKCHEGDNPVLFYSLNGSPRPRRFPFLAIESLGRQSQTRSSREGGHVDC